MVEPLEPYDISNFEDEIMVEPLEPYDKTNNTQPNLDSIRNKIHSLPNQTEEEKTRSKRTCVQFALYCAKDVFHLVPEEQKEKVKLCIDLVESWLKDETSVTSDQLRNAADDAASASAYASYAAYSAASAASASAYASYAAYSAASAASAASYNAANASYYAVQAFPEEQRNQKFQEYANYLNLLLVKYNKPKPQNLKQFLQDNDPTSIAVALDFLEEQGDNWVEEIQEGFKLNIKTMDIIGISKIELAKEIAKHPEIVYWLEEMYR